MADNVVLNAGSGGATLAADDISGVQHQRVKLQYGSDGSATDVSSGTPLPTIVLKDGSLVDANNSTTTPLVGDATFEPANGTEVLGYAAVTITLTADVDSATDGMTFEFSSDDTNWDDVYTFTMDVSEATTRRFQFPVTARYFRLSYTNGSGAQSTFRVQTILHTQNQLTTIHRLVDDMSPDRSAQIVKAAIFGKNGSDIFHPLSTNTAGDLIVAVHAHKSGGTDVFRSLDVDETEEEVYAGECQLYWIIGMNEANATRYLKIYNATAANVTVGTTVPVMTIPLVKELEFNFAVTNGVYFDTAITVAATTGAADNNTGAPGANDVILNVGYKGA